MQSQLLPWFTKAERGWTTSVVLFHRQKRILDREETLTGPNCWRESKMSSCCTS